MSSQFSPRIGSVLLALFFFTAFAGCGSDQAPAPEGPMATGGRVDAAAGALAIGGTGGVTSGVGGRTPSSGGASASAGSSGNAGSGGQLAVAGSASQAGGAGVGASGASSGGAAGALGTGGMAGASGSAGASGVQPNITLWLAGDSTVATGGPCPSGWGGQFKALFNAKVAVTNSAIGGRSVRTWLYDVQNTKDGVGECNLAKDAQGNPTIQARWAAMLTGMKAGDYLFIQFGINDGNSMCPQHVGVTAFKASYGLLAQAAKDRGAHPIFVTPVSQIACSGGTVSKGTREPYVTATKDSGTQFGVPVIDLNVLSTTLYQSLGFCPIPGGSDVSASTTGAVGTFFCDDHTHFDTPGAAKIAGLVAQALRDQNIALAAYLK